MKILSDLFPSRGLPQVKTSFAQALKSAPPGLTKKPSAPRLPGVSPLPAPSAQPTFRLDPTAIVASHQKTEAGLTSARATAHTQVKHLQEARSVHHHVATERLDGRLLDLICKELVIEFTNDPKKPANQDMPLPPPTPMLANASLTPPSIAPAVADGTVRAAQAVALIEKIEHFIKDSRRPSIALTLNNSLGAKVEIERIGPREVALKVIGHRGPPSAEDIGRIRDEMAAHGLKVGALSVA